jgi:uncharacterized protein YcfL
MKTALTFFAALNLLLLAGCQAGQSQLLNQNTTTKYSIESTEKFVLLDPISQASVTCTGLQENVSEGRLDVVANVKNRENRPIELQIRCVFKDEGGFLTGGEPVWQKLTLGEEATEAVRFTAANKLAHNYTIAVRQAR